MIVLQGMAGHLLWLEWIETEAARGHVQTYSGILVCMISVGVPSLRNRW